MNRLDAQKERARLGREPERLGGLLPPAPVLFVDVSEVRLDLLHRRQVAPPQGKNRREEDVKKNHQRDRLGRRGAAGLARAAPLARGDEVVIVLALVAERTCIPQRLLS